MTKPDPSLLNDIVAPKVLHALKLASDALTRAGVRHLVIGGLAVVANGYACRKYLAANAPAYVDAFDDAVRIAAAEEG